MPEPINKGSRPILSDEGYVEISMALRSDGCFVLIFNKKVSEVAFSKLEALDLKNALDIYFGRKET